MATSFTSFLKLLAVPFCVARLNSSVSNDNIEGF